MKITETHPSVFPNPFSSFTTIDFKNPGNERFELSVFDAEGNIVRKESNITSNHFKIFKKELKAGVYLYSLQSKTRKPFRLAISAATTEKLSPINRVSCPITRV
jgi:hypothetical protein